MKNNFLKTCIDYCELGYDISLTSFFGKDAIRMVKRHSHVTEKSLSSVQVIDYDRLENEKPYFNYVARFLYEEIERKEKQLKNK